MVANDRKLTKMQMELLQSFRHIVDEKELAEVKSLLNFYFRNKLDKAIDTKEAEKNYTRLVYEEWLQGHN